MKKALSLFIAVMMVVGIMPLSAINIFAATTEVTLSSTETADYNDLNAAIEAVDDGGTIKILGTYTYADGYVWADHNKKVTIKGEGASTIFDVKAGTLNIFDGVTFTNLTLNKNGGNIYANGNPLKISEDVNMPYKVSIIAGGNATGTTIVGDTKLEIYAGSYAYMFGGSYGGTIEGNTYVTVGSSVNSLYADSDFKGGFSVANVYGGGYTRSNIHGTVTGNTNVTVEDGARFNNVVGGIGISGTTSGNSYVTVTGGDVYRVIGGGRGAAANNTYVNITGGNVNFIHGGSMNAAVEGDTHVYVGENANANCDASSHAYDYLVYGGGYSESADASKANTVKGNTYVTMDGNAKANYVFGGAFTNSTIVGTTHVNINGGTYMSVYGGGRATSVKDTVVTVTGGTIEQLFGGSENAAVTGNTLVRVLDGNISRRIYGGSYNNYASLQWQSSHGVAGTSTVVLYDGANITLDYDDDDLSIYAGSRHPNDVDGTAVLVYADAAAAAKYRKSAYQGAQDTVMKLLMGSKAVADEIHTLSYSVNGNVITETCTDCDHSATASLVVADGANLNYNDGKEIKPAVITYSEGWMAEELGEITYANNKEVGTATATATARYGTATLNFEIVNNVIEVYNEDKEGDNKVSFASLIGTTLKPYTVYMLMEDIDLGGRKLVTGNDIRLSDGVIFDGDGHSIKNFSLTGGKETALFTAHNDKAAITATIKDITFGAADAKIVYDHDGTAYNGYIGFALINQTGADDTLTLSGLTAYVNGDDCKGDKWQDYAIFLGRNNGSVIIDNCHAYGSLKGHGYIGAFIGQNASAQPVEIKNSVNHASVAQNGSRYYGGFIGVNTDTATFTVKTDVTIENCTNNGAVTGEQFTGGFVGYSIGTLKILNSVNNGNVSGSNTAKAGGIVGYVNGGYLLIDECDNFGTVNDSTAGYCGGIVGVIEVALTDGSEIRNCTNNGDVNNVATVTAAQSGGIVAKLSGGVKVTNCVNYGTVKATNMAAGIVTAAKTGTTLNITGCTNNGAVTTTTNTNWWYGAGGITGYLENVTLTVENCTNTGAVTGKAYAGGLIPSTKATTTTISGFVNSGTVNGTIVGGVVGNIQTATVLFSISKSANYGTITGTENVGGFIGNQAAGAIEISGSANYGAVTGTKNVGGVIGYVYGATNVDISSSVNTGAITGTTNGGGIIGYVNAATNLSISNSINEGSITGGNTYAGGIVGYIKSITTKARITESKNLGAVNGPTRAGGAIGILSSTTGTVEINDFFNAGAITGNSATGGALGCCEVAGATISIDRLVNTGTVYGKWNAAPAIGLLKHNTTTTVKNCVNVASMTTGDNNADVMLKYATDYPPTVTASNNYYVVAAKNNKTGATQKTLAEALAILNTPANGYKFGPYAANNAGTGIVLATPEFEGSQLGTTVTDNKIKLRLLATIGDVNLSDKCEYTYLGFKITVDGKEPVYTGVRYVYESIIAKNGDKEVTYTAQALGGKYIYAEVLTLDATVAHTITVQTFASNVDTNNPQETDLYYGGEYVVNVPVMAEAN